MIKNRKYVIFKTMNELSPKELYEQKKKEKLGAQAKSEAAGRVKKFLIWAVILIVIGHGKESFRAQNLRRSDCRSGTSAYKYRPKPPGI